MYLRSQMITLSAVSISNKLVRYLLLKMFGRNESITSILLIIILCKIEFWYVYRSTRYRDTKMFLFFAKNIITFKHQNVYLASHLALYWSVLLIILIRDPLPDKFINLQSVEIRRYPSIFKGHHYTKTLRSMYIWYYLLSSIRNL